MPHVDDEFLSALLDGEAAEGDAAHVEGCDRCQSRLGALREVSAAVGGSIPVPGGAARDAAVATAIASGDGAAVGAHNGSGSLLRLRRGERAVKAAPHRMSALSAAAVLVVALAIGGLAISQISRGTSHDNSTAFSAGALGTGPATTANVPATDSAADGGDIAAGAAAPPLASKASSGESASPYDGGELGAVDDIGKVSARAANDLNQPNEQRAAKAAGQPSPCPYGDTGAGVWQATLTYKGEAAVAHLIQADDGSRVMQVLRRANCAVIATRAFAPTTPR